MYILMVFTPMKVTANFKIKDRNRTEREMHLHLSSFGWNASQTTR